MYQPLFPTMSNVEAVVNKAYADFPPHMQNQVKTILATYHNTLLAQLERESNLVIRK